MKKMNAILIYEAHPDFYRVYRIHNLTDAEVADLRLVSGKVRNCDEFSEIENAAFDRVHDRIHVDYYITDDASCHGTWASSLWAGSDIVPGPLSTVEMSGQWMIVTTGWAY